MKRIAYAVVVALARGTCASAEGNRHNPEPTQPITDFPDMEAGSPPEVDGTTAMRQTFGSVGARAQGDYLYVIDGHTGKPRSCDREGFKRNLYRRNSHQHTSWKAFPGGGAHDGTPWLISSRRHRAHSEAESLVHLP